MVRDIKVKPHSMKHLQIHHSHAHLSGGMREKVAYAVRPPSVVLSGLLTKYLNIIVHVCSST